jgi:hypothetical protein
MVGFYSPRLPGGNEENPPRFLENEKNPKGAPETSEE